MAVNFSGTIKTQGSADAYFLVKKNSYALQSGH